jgi:hypothetical protein
MSGWSPFAQCDLSSRGSCPDNDRALLDRIEPALVDGIALKHWWEEKERSGAYVEKFNLARTFNGPNQAYGFFDAADLRGERLQLMGVVQRMVYDARDVGQESLDEFREFVLTHFLRVSDFREPESFPSDVREAPHRGSILSWCPGDDPRLGGFGCSQSYFKDHLTGAIGKFPARDEYAIVDLRQLGEHYDWIVVKIRIFDFNFTFEPFGPDSPKLVVPSTQQNYVVLSRDFIRNVPAARPGDTTTYGFGYALVQYDPTPSVFAYGPGRFRAGFQTIVFDVTADGTTTVTLAFVTTRPEQILQVDLDPVDWSLSLANWLTLGLAAPIIEPLRDLLGRGTLSLGRVDPLSAYVSMINAATANVAASQWCISRKQLEQDMLLQHFSQHYRMITGSLQTWRHVPNWLDAKALPAWVLTGRSS